MSAHKIKPNTQQTNDAIACVKRGIARLSQNVSKDNAQQQVEGLCDDVIDLLNAALCRLGFDRHEK